MIVKTINKICTSLVNDAEFVLSFECDGNVALNLDFKPGSVCNE